MPDLAKPCAYCGFPALGRRCPCGLPLCDEYCALQHWPRHKHQGAYRRRRRVLAQYVPPPVDMRIMELLNVRNIDE